jgi:GAF domain-containing protein
MISQRLAEALLRFSSTLTEDFMSQDSLDQLMQTAVEELSVGGVGTMLYDRENELRFVSASDERVRLVEDFQVETGEGPCVVAAQTGEVVITDDLRDGDERFPSFAVCAAAGGLLSVHSFPMVIEGISFGALNLYRDTPGRLDEHERKAGMVFADMATSYLMNARRLDDASNMVLKVRQAMDRSAPIEQGKGYVAGVLRIDPKEAFDLIRAYARSNRASVVEVGERLVDGSLDIAALRHKTSS